MPPEAVYDLPFHNDRDREIKCNRLREYLDRIGLDELWLATDGNVGWLLGADPLVVRSSPVGVAAVRFDGETLSVVTDNIEAGRLRDEELPAGIEIVKRNWYAGSIAETVESRAGPAAAADIPVSGLSSIDASAIRLPHTAGDIDRLREIGRATAEGLEATCREITPSDTEREVAADLARRLGDRGIDTPVRLVGGAERVGKYRHFTPTDTPVGDYAIVSVSARRGGLWVSATRTVAFTPPSWLTDRHDAATRVDATAIAATQRVPDGGTAGDVFAAIRSAYDEVGHPDEWKHHHQGGATGYASREWVATPGDTTTIESPIAVAWNPTIQGAKSEDSVLVTEETIEVLTSTGSWPTSTVESIDGHVMMERPAVLAA